MIHRSIQLSFPSNDTIHFNQMDQKFKEQPTHQIVDKFIAPGSFSRAYNAEEPTREMQGGRRQTLIFQEQDKLQSSEVHKLINHARIANTRSTPSAKIPVHHTRKTKQQQKVSELSQAKRTRAKSPRSSPTKHGWGGTDRFGPDSLVLPGEGSFQSIETGKGSPQTYSSPSSPLILPDAPSPDKLGTTLTSRAAAQSTTLTRKSSPGSVLRRGSQVGTAPRRNVRQYRHPRDMEAALIDTEAKIALLEDKLDATTSVLRRTQQELLQRNADLEAANLKTNSLLLMVQELLQHVVEKREGRRFSETASLELNKLLESPAKHYSANDDMKDYIGTKINAIDALLPKWTSLSTDFMNDAMDDDSNFGDGDDMYLSPPPLPPNANKSRRSAK